MCSIETTLYYAHWCRHCTTFEPIWDEFASLIDKSSGKLNGIKVVTKKYEEKDLIEKKPTINGKSIRGFPTVKISVTHKNGKSVEYEYNGKRTKDDLINHIVNKAPKNFD